MIFQFFYHVDIGLKNKGSAVLENNSVKQAVKIVLIP